MPNFRLCVVLAFIALPILRPAPSLASDDYTWTITADNIRDDVRVYLSGNVLYIEERVSKRGRYEGVACYETSLDSLGSPRSYESGAYSIAAPNAREVHGSGGCSDERGSLDELTFANRAQVQGFLNWLQRARSAPVRNVDANDRAFLRGDAAPPSRQGGRFSITSEDRDFLSGKATKPAATANANQKSVSIENVRTKPNPESCFSADVPDHLKQEVEPLHAAGGCWVVEEFSVSRYSATSLFMKASMTAEFTACHAGGSLKLFNGGRYPVFAGLVASPMEKRIESQSSAVLMGDGAAYAPNAPCDEHQQIKVMYWSPNGSR